MAQGKKLDPNFWANVDVRGADECWGWLRATQSSGYGTLYVGGKNTLVHRHAYELAHGPIPDGLLVLHRCDNRRCCNPAHLWLGTIADNLRDRDVKGRNGLARLTADQVRAIRAAYATGKITNDELGRRYGVTASTVQYITSGKTWKHLED